MKNEQINYRKILKKYRIKAFCLGIIAFSISGLLFAQTDQGNLNFDGELHTRSYTGTAADYTVPNNADGSMLFLSLQGADGGWAKDESGQKGGGGATVSASFAIGNGTGQIPAGSKMRLIVGAAGQSGGKHGGGGGGTGVAFQAPQSTSWNLLLVAGGGGGSGKKYSGRSAETIESGSNGIGRNNTKNKNTAGQDGKGGDDVDSYGGGGAYGDGAGDWNDNEKTSRKGGLAGYQFNEPIGGAGGSCDGCISGGFGFGGGGAAGKDDATAWSYYSGGGGGGYSGGGGGDQNGGGGGGGSYVNTDYAMENTVVKKQNELTTDPQNGYVQYRLYGDPNIDISAIEVQGPDASSPQAHLRVTGSSDGTLECRVNAPGSLNMVLNIDATPVVPLMLAGDYTLKFYSSEAPANVYNETYAMEYSQAYTAGINENPEISPATGTDNGSIRVKAFASADLKFTLYRLESSGTTGAIPGATEQASNATGLFTQLPKGSYAVTVEFQDKSIDYSKNILNIQI